MITMPHPLRLFSLTLFLGLCLAAPLDGGSDIISRNVKPGDFVGWQGEVSTDSSGLIQCTGQCPAPPPGFCPALPAFVDTTPQMTAEIFADLRGVRAAKLDDEFLQLDTELPPYDEEPTEKRDLQPRGDKKRVLEATGYRMAYAKCIGQWVFITPQGELLILQETSDEVGRSAEVDHLLELQQIKLFFQDPTVISWLKGKKLKAADMYNKCITCHSITEELKNILNNAVNFFGVDKDINRAKGQVVGGKKFDWSKFDAAHTNGFCEYLTRIGKAYREIAKRVGAALQEAFGNDALGAYFSNWANKKLRSWIDECNGHRTKSAPGIAAAKSKKTKVSFLDHNIIPVTRNPNLDSCAVMPTLQIGLPFTWTNAINRAFLAVAAFKSIVS